MEIARRIESAKRSAVSYRNYRRARDRAMTRLSNAYPETYKELLELLLRFQDSMQAQDSQVHIDLAKQIEP